MKYANLIIEKTTRLRNYGEDIQIHAIKNLYEYMGIDYKHVVRISPQELFTYDGDEYLVVPINYPFFGQYERLAPKIIPVYLGISFLGISENLIENLRMREFSPIGCRDQRTLEILQKKNVDAYLNGCMTITLPKVENRDNANKIYLVDVCDELVEYIPEKLKRNAEYRTHVFYDRVVTEEESMAAYEEYRQNAKLVITSRLHAAVPCAAYGIPVVYAPKRRTTRSAWLQKLMPVYDESTFMNINWSPRPLEIEGLKKIILKNAAERVQEVWNKYFLRCSISERYYDKELRNQISEDMYAPVKFMEDNWKSESSCAYIIWGITQTSETLYQYISENYKNASLIGVIDLYRKVNFNGVISGGLEQLNEVKDVTVFVAAESANALAIDYFEKTGITNYVICMNNENYKMNREDTQNIRKNEKLKKC